MDDEHKPVDNPRRSSVGPIALVVVLLCLVAVAFLVIFTLGPKNPGGPQRPGPDGNSAPPLSWRA